MDSKERIRTSQDMETIFLNAAYYMILGAQLLMYRLDSSDKGDMFYYKKRGRLESAARLVQGAMSSLKDSGKMSKKAIDLASKLGSTLDKVADGTDKSRRFLQAALSELEVFDEDYSSMTVENLDQARRDSNEFVAVFILYLYDTYIDASIYSKTLRFLEKEAGAPIDWELRKNIEYFIKKSNL